nr:phosphoribosylglycinamide formyltransferase [Spelaeicoccus albus]
MLPCRRCANRSGIVTAVRLVVLASGQGTLTQALIDAANAGAPFTIVAIGTDKPDAAVLARATASGIDTFCCRLPDYASRADWDAALAAAVAEHRPDLIVSAGFMKILGDAFLTRFEGRIINTHPALLPSFPGAHAVPDALAYGASVTGSTVHFVDAGVDTGPIIAQRAIDVDPDDTEESLHARIKAVEHALLIEVVRSLAERGWTLSGRRVRLGPETTTPSTRSTRQ